MKPVILTANEIELLRSDCLWVAEADVWVPPALTALPRDVWNAQRERQGLPPADPGVYAFTGPEWVIRATPVADQYWVKEDWAISGAAKEYDSAVWHYQGWSVWYRSDGSVRRGSRPRDEQGDWRPARTMPAWASRYTAKTTDTELIRYRDVPELTKIVGHTQDNLEKNRWCWHYRLALI